MEIAVDKVVQMWLRAGAAAKIAVDEGDRNHAARSIGPIAKSTRLLELKRLLGFEEYCESCMLCLLDMADAGELTGRNFARTARLLLRFKSYGLLVSERWPTRLDTGGPEERGCEYQSGH